MELQNCFHSLRRDASGAIPSLTLDAQRLCGPRSYDNADCQAPLIPPLASQQWVTGTTRPCTVTCFPTWHGAADLDLLFPSLPVL
jgi:hypothetical protein